MNSFFFVIRKEKRILKEIISLHEKYKYYLGTENQCILVLPQTSDRKSWGGGSKIEKERDRERK